jgi:PST family polysaccharide transporter
MRRMFVGGGWLYLSQVLAAALSFPLSILLAHVLGAGQYGMWGAALALAATTRAIVSFDITNPLTRFLVAARHDARPDAMRLLLGSSLAADALSGVVTVAAVLWLAPSFAGHLAGQAALPAYWLAAFAILVGFPQATWFCVARDQSRFPLMAALMTTQPAVQLMVALVLRHFGALTLTSLAATYFGASVFVSVLQVLSLDLMVRRYGIRRFVLWPAELWRRAGEIGDFWRFMGQLYLGTTLAAFIVNADMLILGWHRSAAEVGCYRLAKQCFAMFDGVSVAVSAVLYQHLSEQVAARRYAHLRTWLLRLTSVWAPLTLAAVVVAALLAQPFVRLVFGAEFAPAVPMLRVLLIASAARAIMMWGLPLLQLLGRYSFQLKQLLWATPLTVWGMNMGARHYGAVGVAAALAVLYWVLSGILTFEALRTLRIRSAESAAAA